MSRLAVESRLKAALLIAAAMTIAGAALARTSDRNQPLDVEATSTDCSASANGPCTFSGNVHIVQGTLDIRAAHADIRRGGGDIQRVLLTGSPALMKQQMDDGALINARAAKVDYDLATDTVVFTGNAFIEQPGQSSISSERIVYNMKSGQVQGGGQGAGRVKMTLLPKGGQKKAPTPAKPKPQGQR